MIRIEAAGIEAVDRRLLDVPKRVERAVIGKMADVVFAHARRGADEHTKTGALVQSLYNRPIPGGREIGHDPQRAPHAVFVHWGTKPHVIKPKNRKMLRWPVGGAFAFAREVHHPGYKGDAWLVRAADFALRDFDRIVQHALKEL